MSWWTADSFILPKVLVLRAVVVLLVATLVGRWWRSGRISWRRTPLDLPLAALLLSATLSTVVADNRDLAVFGAYERYEGLLTIVAYGALFWLSVQCIDGGAGARGLVRALLTAGCVVALLGILQVLVESSRGTGAGESAVAFGGLYRATSTFGNANALGMFLAMLVPLAAGQALAARTTRARVLAADALVLIVLALVLTFSRSAWLGAVLGVAVAGAASPLIRQHRCRVVVAVTAAVIVAAGVAVAARSGVPAAAAVTSRATSLASPAGGTGGTRVHVWIDSMALVASQPIVGYGPDSFGLEFPRFATGAWTPGSLLDKAHSDVLQVAATQGLIGVGAYVWLVGAIGVMLWRGRRGADGAALLGAFVAYELTVQLNFSYLPSAAPFWLFLAVAAVSTSDDRRYDREIPPVTRRTLAVGAWATLAAVTYPAVVQPYRADATYLAALGAAIDSPRAAAADAAVARAEAPWEAVYAVEAGDLAEGLDAADQTAADANWVSARDAYLAADRLGCADPAVFRHLALADLHLGLRDEALRAARRSVALDRFNVDDGALLRQLGG